jgi:hypothetical protein
MVIAGLSFCWITKFVTVGASKMILARTIMATIIDAAALRAPTLFFFGVGMGTETKLFRTPHWGQADNSESYLQPQTMQSIYESVVC